MDFFDGLDDDGILDEEVAEENEEWYKTEEGQEYLREKAEAEEARNYGIHMSE